LQVEYFNRKSRLILNYKRRNTFSFVMMC